MDIRGCALLLGRQPSPMRRSRLSAQRPSDIPVSAKSAPHGCWRPRAVTRNRRRCSFASERARSPAFLPGSLEPLRHSAEGHLPTVLPGGHPPTPAVYPPKHPPCVAGHAMPAKLMATRCPAQKHEGESPSQQCANPAVEADSACRDQSATSALTWASAPSPLPPQGTS